MHIIDSTFEKGLFSNGTVVVLGNFDGVHKGHTEIINRAKQAAKDSGLPLLVYTFSKHPKGALQITLKDEKEEIFSSLGVDYIFYEDFSRVCSFSPERFCKEVLLEMLCARYVFCGENFRFGKGAAGTSAMLEEYLSKAVSVQVVKSVMYEHEIVCSTRIRQCLSLGDTQMAHKLLGRPYFMTLPVIHGNHLGTSFGFPTINQEIPSEKMLVAFGVYCCVCTLEEKRYMAVANVGIKPTVTHGKNAQVLCETHILDFKGDLYGKRIKVEFYKKLRDEKKFESLSELSAEIKKNVSETKEYFENEKIF